MIALELFFGSGDHLFGVHRVYDEAEQEYSPGGLINLSFFQYIEEQDQYVVVDSCTKPTNPFTYRQYNAAALTTTQLLAIGGLRSRLGLRFFGWLRDRVRKGSDRAVPSSR